MGGAESRGASADSFHLVLVVARLKLWLILMTFLKVGLCRFLIWDLGQFFAKTSTIEPVTLANLMVYLRCRAS